MERGSLLLHKSSLGYKISPDPFGETLAILRKRTNEALTMRQYKEPFIKQAFETFFTPDTLLWIDYCCMPQKPRTADEKKLFSHLLSQMGHFYRTNMVVLRCYTSDNWKNRGWCAFENFLGLICGYDRPPRVTISDPECKSLSTNNKEKIVNEVLQDCIFTKRDSDPQIVKNLLLQVLDDMVLGHKPTFFQSLRLKRQANDIIPFTTYHGPSCSHCEALVLTLDNIQHLRIDYGKLSFDQVISKFSQATKGIMKSVMVGHFKVSSIKRLFIQNCIVVARNIGAILSPVEVDLPWTIRVDLFNCSLLYLCIPEDVDDVESNLDIKILPPLLPEDIERVNKMHSYHMNSSAIDDIEHYLEPVGPDLAIPPQLSGRRAEEEYIKVKEMGNQFFLQSKYHDALRNYQAALHHAASIGDPVKHAVYRCTIHGNRAAAFFHLHQINRAITTCLISIACADLCDSEKPHEIVAKQWARVAHICWQQGNLKEARKCLNASIREWPDKEQTSSTTPSSDMTVFMKQWKQQRLILLQHLKP